MQAQFQDNLCQLRWIAA